MIQKYSLLLAVMLPIHKNLFCQANLQDANGESKFYENTRSSSWISLNTSSESIKLGFMMYDKSNTSDYSIPTINGNFIFGLELAATPKNGIANILAKQSISPGVSLNGNFGITGESNIGNNFFTLYIRPSISYNQYAVIVPSAGILTPQLTKFNRWQPAMEIDFNDRYNDNKPDTTKNILFWAASVGLQRTNNYTLLNDASYNTIVTTGGNVQVVTSQAGKVGVFKEYNAIPFTFDLAVTPRIFKQKVIGFNLFSRNNIIEAKIQSNIGAGVYFSNPVKVSDVVGGIGYQLNDIFNTADNKGNSFQRATLFFYIGYSIGKTAESSSKKSSALN